MGGNAFTELLTPRLPHELYLELRERCHEILSRFYEKVVTPAEAPSKTDHGDIDCMAMLLKNSKSSTMPTDEIAKALGAVKFKKTSGSATTHFAVPIAKDSARRYGLSDSDDEAELFAQVDVHVVHDPTYFHWEHFMQSYGDLGQILGVLNRPLGLTATDRGLFLRIKEIEPSNRKKSMLFLTSSVSEMLSFLRLDEEVYERGFESDKEIFAWCVNGGMYNAPKVREESSNDRHRLKTRKMFVEFMRVWFPERREELFPASRKTWSREEVLEEALRFFPDARPVYEALISEHVRSEFVESVLEAMKLAGQSLGADGREIGEVIRGSKRFIEHESYVTHRWRVAEGPTCDKIETTPKWMEHIETEDDKAAFLEWFSAHWKDILQRENARMQSGKEMRLSNKEEDRKSSADAKESGSAPFVSKLAGALDNAI